MNKRTAAPSRCDILLVEDDADDREMIKEALRELGAVYDLLEAKDGAEAVDLLKTFSESSLPSLVLLDINLPKLRGHEVLREIRASPLTRRLPVVMLTSSDNDDDVARSYDLGANGYVVKPAGFENYCKAIEGLCTYWLRINRRPLAPVRR